MALTASSEARSGERRADAQEAAGEAGPGRKRKNAAADAQLAAEEGRVWWAKTLAAMCGVLRRVARKRAKRGDGARGGGASGRGEHLAGNKRDAHAMDASDRSVPALMYLMSDASKKVGVLKSSELTKNSLKKPNPNRKTLVREIEKSANIAIDIIIKCIEENKSFLKALFAMVSAHSPSSLDAMLRKFMKLEVAVADEMFILAFGGIVQSMKDRNPDCRWGHINFWIFFDT